MTDERAHQLAQAALTFISIYGEKRFWLAVAKDNKINDRTYNSRVEAGMEPEAAATFTGSLRRKSDPNSIRQRCYALGYKGTRRYTQIKEELEDLGIEYTVDDVFDIIAARKRDRVSEPTA